MKKTNFFKLAVCAMCVVSVFGCKEAQKGKAMFTSYNLEKQAHLTAESESPVCSVSIDFNYVAGDDSVSNIVNRELVKEAFDFDSLQPKEAVDSFVTHYIHNYSQELLPYYKEDKEEGKERMGWYNYYYNLKTDVRNGKEGILNYVLEMDSYEGGAHGNQVTTYLNFDMKDGHLITLNDLFVEGYKETLNDILLKKLMKKVDVSSTEALQEKGYSWMEMFPTNFLLKKDCVEFLYNAYEIAPYSMGMTVLEVPYTELTDILKN